MPSSSSAPLAPTRFVVRSYESKKRSLPRTILPISAIIGGLYYFDPYIQNEIIWVLGGLLAGLILFDTASWKREIVLTVSVGPLGVQRTSRRNDDSTKQSPFLPRESIQECLVIEHVGAFAVSTHVVFRLRSLKGYEQKKGQQLIPAFPHASMNFEQCQSLVKLIRQALRET